ncbi:MAG: ABC transporter ATP-binding protein [bacterium]|nr:ABC transporter ATP-binding protein [bacterium]
MAPLIELRDVKKSYQDDGVATLALRGVSFSINQGEFVSIMGPSGSGKSTLLHILGLLDKPSEGKYFFDGHDTTKFDEPYAAHFRNEQIGFIFQAFHLLARSTVMENVLLPLQYSSIPKNQHEKRALAMLEKVNMLHRLKHRPSQLSGGEKQRVAIARALVNNPKVLMADEPTGNLDSQSGKSVMETLDNLHHQGHTILVITHETPAARYAQRMIRVQDGTIVSDEQSSLMHGHNGYEK